eukprot:784613-Rhodomonas_salina.1
MMTTINKACARVTCECRTHRLARSGSKSPRPRRLPFRRSERRKSRPRELRSRAWRSAQR